MAARVNFNKRTENMTWEDITEFVSQTTKEFAVGQMIHKDSFGLYDAMSAIEIMDPKMDSGVNYAQFYSVDERLEMGILPIPDQNMPLNLVIEVVDRLIACQVTWFSGFSLCQTLFTCLYFHKSGIITNPHLRLFSRLLLKACESVRMLIIRGDIYEEEDFITNTFGFPLGEGILDEDLAKEFKEEEDQFIQSTKQLKQQKKESSPEQSAEIEHSLLLNEAFLARLRFMRAFYTTQAHFDRPQLAKGLEAAKKSIVYAQSQLELLKSTRIKLNQQAIPTSIQEQLNLIFDSDVGRCLQAPTPSRVIPIAESLDAFDQLNSILATLDQLTTLPTRIFPPVAHNAPKVDEIDSLALCYDFFHEFSAKNPNVIARSRLVLLFNANKMVLGERPMQQLVKESLEVAGIPKEIVESTTISSFIDSLSKGFLQYFRLMAFNRARQRRKLVHLLDEWNNLQLLAAQTDEQIAKSFKLKVIITYFGVWIIEHVIDSMIYFLQLGFELELYHPAEYAPVFWYLDYLYGSQLHHKQAFSEILEKGRKKGKNIKPRTVPHIYTYKLYLIEANLALSRGIFRTLYALHCHFDQVQLPYSPLVTFPLGNPEYRFHYRFSCFLKIASPAPIFYSHYQETTSFAHLTAEAILDASSECFKQAKHCIERLTHRPTNVLPQLSSFALPKLQTLARVIIMDSLQIQQCINQRKQIKDNSSFTAEQQQQSIPKISFAQHPFYPVFTK